MLACGQKTYRRAQGRILGPRAPVKWPLSTQHARLPLETATEPRRKCPLVAIVKLGKCERHSRRLGPLLLSRRALAEAKSATGRALLGDLNFSPLSDAHKPAAREHNSTRLASTRKKLQLWRARRPPARIVHKKLVGVPRGLSLAARVESNAPTQERAHGATGKRVLCARAHERAGGGERALGSPPASQPASERARAGRRASG